MPRSKVGELKQAAAMLGESSIALLMTKTVGVANTALQAFGALPNLPITTQDRYIELLITAPTLISATP